MFNYLNYAKKSSQKRIKINNKIKKLKSSKEKIISKLPNNYIKFALNRVINIPIITIYQFYIT